MQKCFLLPSPSSNPALRLQITQTHLRSHLHIHLIWLRQFSGSCYLTHTRNLAGNAGSGSSVLFVLLTALLFYMHLCSVWLHARWRDIIPCKHWQLNPNLCSLELENAHFLRGLMAPLVLDSHKCWMECSWRNIQLEGSAKVRSCAHPKPLVIR